ncbi:MAG: glycosyltransferase [Pseudomonadota bacterium]
MTGLQEVPVSRAGSRSIARILILTLGSRGDVQPYVALGGGLARRGHAVTVSTGQGFDALIADHGLRPDPLSIDIPALMESKEIRAALTSLRGRLATFRSMRQMMQQQLDEMADKVSAATPDIVVYNIKAFVAPYLARAHGVLAIPGCLQPAFMPTGAFPFPLARLPDLGAWSNRLMARAFIGLMGVSYRAMLRAWLKRHTEVAARPPLDVLRGYHPRGAAIPRLHAHSAALVPKPADWEPDDHVTGAWFLPTHETWDMPDDLAAFLEAGPPPVYFGFGSMPAVDAERTAETVMKAIAASKVRAIVARGWGALAAATGSPAIHVLDKAPHDRLFPHCAAVVHHGGAGTTHEGLRWGCPTLVCPVFGDQPFWGDVVAGKGAGPTPIRLKGMKADDLTAALTTLQTDAVRRSAAGLAEAIQKEDGINRAADLIETASAR